MELQFIFQEVTPIAAGIVTDFLGKLPSNITGNRISTEVD